MILLTSDNWSFQGNTHMVLELEVAAAIVGQIGIIKVSTSDSAGTVLALAVLPVCRQILNALSLKKKPFVYPISGRGWHDNVASTCTLCVRRFPYCCIQIARFKWLVLEWQILKFYYHFNTRASYIDQIKVANI